MIFFNAYDVLKEGGYIALGFVGGVDTVLDIYEVGRSLMNHDWTGAAFAAVVLVIPCVGAHTGKALAKGLESRAVRELGEEALEEGVERAVRKSAKRTSEEVIHVTKDGVALPLGAKYSIPDHYVQNPHRSGSYGEIVNGKFKERLRIDPPTPPGNKGPNYAHYHKNGKGRHYSPRPGDLDPGF